MDLSPLSAVVPTLSDAMRIVTRRRRQPLDPHGHGLIWQVANAMLFVLALVAAVVVLFGVMYGMWWLASEGS